ncbi:MAG: phosphoribosyl-AMP cyclohydrolase [Coriobacteriia bacterium]|nr:phosphoribosyl-AMP cyclohydrolase [Coriobacteriia bacterium]
MDMERDVLQVEDLKYDEKGLIPAVIQQFDSLEVLMVAYMNEESLRKTIETGRTWFWSRSRKQYWMKGETSGHVQDVKEILYDCDADTLLVLVDQTGAACHTQSRTCFYRRLYPTVDAGLVTEGEGNAPLS